MNERAAFVDRWREYGEPLETELVYFQCIVLATSGLRDNRIGAVYSDTWANEDNSFRNHIR